MTSIIQRLIALYRTHDLPNRGGRARSARRIAVLLAVGCALAASGAILIATGWGPKTAPPVAQGVTQIVFAAAVPADTEGPPSVVEGEPVKRGGTVSNRPTEPRAAAQRTPTSSRRRIEINNAKNPLGDE